MTKPTPIQQQHLTNLLALAKEHCTEEQHATLKEHLAVSQDNLNVVEISFSSPKNYLMLEDGNLKFGDTLSTWHTVEPKSFWPSIADQLAAMQEDAA